MNRLAVIALSLLLTLLSAGIRIGDFHWPITGYPAIPTPTAQTAAVRGAVNKSPPHSAPRADVGSAVPAQQRQGGPATLPSTVGTFAELPSTDDQAIGFTGYVKDSETGLYYAKARYYDPRIARFTTQDPEEGNAMQPPRLHRYLYAYANPTVYTDPTGRCPVESDRCGLETAVAMAAGPHEQAIAEDVLVAYDAEAPMRGRAALSGLAAGTVFVPGGLYARAAFGIGRAAYTTWRASGAAVALFEHGAAITTVAGVGTEAVACGVSGAAICPPSAIPSSASASATLESRAAQTTAQVEQAIAVSEGKLSTVVVESEPRQTAMSINGTSAQLDAQANAAVPTGAGAGQSASSVPWSIAPGRRVAFDQSSNRFRDLSTGPFVAGSSVQPSDLARGFQGEKPYFGVDPFVDQTLPAGTRIATGVHSSELGDISPFLTTEEALQGTLTAEGLVDANAFNQGLQIYSSRQQFRPGVTVFELTAEQRVAAGPTINNPQFNPGDIRNCHRHTSQTRSRN